MINVRGLQRNVKNVVKNYTEAQVKVREATSNDKWGAPSTLMAEIADLTYNVVAFSEIMQMIWKRLNDHGKNWRHVYKALTLLDYLIKAGSEKVAQQCRDNIFAIQTLKDFQYIEDNKDQGLNVREKSKALVALLKDEEKLKVERARALKTKERFAQSVSYMSNSASMETLPKTSASYHEGLDRGGGLRSGSAPVNNELEQARPQTIGEEELQLQLALAMSKEEAEADERQRKNDDLRLKLALTESEKEKQKKKASALDDLLSIDLGNNSFAGNNTSLAATNQQLDPWSVVETNSNQNNHSNGLDAFGGGAVGGLGISSKASNGTSTALAISNDPWSPTTSNGNSDSLIGATSANFSQIDNDPWSPPKAITNESSMKSNSLSTSPWQSNSIVSANNDPWSSPLNNSASALPLQPINNHHQISSIQSSTRKTPETFLGANSNLVNLDALVSGKAANANTSNSSLGSNPFASVSVPSNPFQKPPAPTINQLRSQNNFPLDSVNFMSSSNLSSSLPSQQTNSLNSLLLSQPQLNPTLTSTSNQSNPFAM